MKQFIWKLNGHSFISALLHHWMARLLAERLSDNNKTLEALLN